MGSEMCIRDSGRSDPYNSNKSTKDTTQSAGIIFLKYASTLRRVLGRLVRIVWVGSTVVGGGGDVDRVALWGPAPRVKLFELLLVKRAELQRVWYFVASLANIKHRHKLGLRNGDPTSAQFGTLIGQSLDADVTRAGKAQRRPNN